MIHATSPSPPLLLYAAAFVFDKIKQLNRPLIYTSQRCEQDDFAQNSHFGRLRFGLPDGRNRAHDADRRPRAASPWIRCRGSDSAAAWNPRSAGLVPTVRCCYHGKRGTGELVLTRLAGCPCVCTIFEKEGRGSGQSPFAGPSHP